MRHSLVAVIALLSACASRPSQMPAGVGWERLVIQRSNSGEDIGLRATQLRPDICDGYDLRPDATLLNEASVARFLQQQRFELQVQRQVVDPKSPELHYLFVNVPGLSEPLPLRVAVLQNADEAGRALYDALLQRGSGAWGVHRSNVALLGPRGGTGDDIAFAAATKLACWGTLTIQGSEDTVVIPGGYAEP